MILLFAIFYVAAGGYAHYYRAHVRVDVIYASVSERGRAILDIATAVLFFIFVGVFVYTSWTFYWSSQTMAAGAEVLGYPRPGRALLHRLGTGLLPGEVHHALRGVPAPAPGRRLADP